MSRFKSFKNEGRGTFAIKQGSKNPRKIGLHCEKKKLFRTLLNI